MLLIKSQKEIDGIRRACRLASDALSFAGTIVRPGVSTIEINDSIVKFLADRGGRSAVKGYQGFPADACISVNDVVCHGIPNSKRLQNGDAVKIDITTFLDGFYGDTCRTYLVGKVSSEIEFLSKTAFDALNLGISRVGPGNPISSIGFAIEPFVKSRGFSLVREFAGHGVGLSIHEEPTILHYADPYTTTLMRSGMVFTIEPAIAIGSGRMHIEKDGWTVKTNDGGWSSQYEHTVLVTEDGCEVLTQTGDVTDTSRDAKATQM